MKKTININIGNSIIHIEEDAYEILKKYLADIKQHFSKTADHQEIVSDIESRIVEMLVEILDSQQKKVVDSEDIQKVILQMGNVNDFELDEEEEDIKPHYNKAKKIYRDTDRRIIAGVCSGLAYYFNVEVKWVRLGFVILSLLFIGFGPASLLLGVFPYLLLWLIAPVARTRSEKMAMRGEETNLQGFIKDFDLELENIKRKFSSANDQIPSFLKSGGNFIRQIIESIAKVVTFLWKIALKIAAGGIAFFGIITSLALIASIFIIIGFWTPNFNEYFFLNAVNPSDHGSLVINVFLLLFIPVLALVLFALRVAFNVNAINKTFSFALLIIWLAAIFHGVYLGAKIASQFKENAEFSKTIPIKSYPAYTLEMNNLRTFSKEDSIKYHLNTKKYKNRVILNNRRLFNENLRIRLRIETSSNEKTSLIQRFVSKGSNFNDALENAQNITYNFSQEDSVLMISSNLQLNNPAVWRDQELYLTLKIPKNTKLIINSDLNRYIDRYDLWFCKPDNGKYGEWIMTDEGLKCINEELYNSKQEN
jgi:phage shock protein PspC (stress-responsive transcriptional regulator)